MPRRRAFLLAAIAPLTTAAAWADANLSYLLSTLKSQPRQPIPLAVTAVTEVKGRELLLKFHITNISNEVLSFGAWELPWGHPNSISYVALTMDGKALPNGGFYTECCDTIANISIVPSGSLDGIYDLRLHLDEKSLPKDADLLVVWVWRVRTGDGGKVDRGTATGVAWIHTPK